MDQVSPELIRQADRLTLARTADPVKSRAMWNPKIQVYLEQVGSLYFQARDLCPTDWPGALKVLKAANLGLGRINPPAYLANTLMGFGWAVKANALRIQEKMAEARDALDRAQDMMSKGNGALDAMAYLLSIRASCERDDWQAEQASLAARYSAECFLRLRWPVPAACALLKQALAERLAGNLETAKSCATEAQFLLPIEDELHWVVAANKALILAELGEDREAAECLAQARLAPLQTGPWQALLCWVEGLVAREAESDYPKADRLLREAARRFEELNGWSSLGPVLMDVALNALRQGKLGEVEVLLEQVTALALTAEFPQALVGSVGALRQAAREAKLTLGHLAELRRLLVAAPLQNLRHLKGQLM